MTTRAFITGAGGQVGVDLIAALRERGCEVHGSDIADRPSTVDASVRWHKVDVTDAAAVRRAIQSARPDVVYHLAAILSSGGEEKPQLCYLVNQTGTWNVLEACREEKVPRVAFASTIAAFGPGLPDPVPNEVPMRPRTMYGVTKVAGELLGEYYTARGWTDFRSVRFPGLISAGKPGQGTSDYALYMYTDGIKFGRYEAFCRPDSKIPFMYMPDAIDGLIGVAEAPRERLGKRCTYNIQGFSPLASEFAEVVAAAVPGVKITFKPVEWRQAILDSWPRSLDDTVARADWDWCPKYGLDAMTKDIIPKIREKLARGEL
ncbi:MAG: NAD-dependent epimerase/dehydratase family protein [Planctomycetes bacterium]|nr:NAD-dependent epimerase/dehydratase family protein [Planctomycetota bacterium]